MPAVSAGSPVYNYLGPYTTSLRLPEQTCPASFNGINLGFGPRRLSEPRRQLATIEELAFLRLDGAQLRARMAADRAVGVCRCR
jgi:hypothetical protein